jgi:para-nitrobenzyl esterase
MANRRTVMQGLAGAGIALLSGAGARSTERASEESPPIAKTADGALRGTVHNDILTFLGVPYGSSTAGTSRFMPPKRPTPWSGVREATAYGDSCPQISFGTSPFVKQPAPGEMPPAPTEMQKQIGSLYGDWGREARQSEDCLVLNLWTPALDAAKRPVMVWLHGGGFGVGSGSAAAFEGSALARRGDVVVVTINHRLNVLGYLFLGDIAGEEFASSGNVGMLDVVQALEWVRDNIGSFGGDPGNVTIFGESGGAGKVSVVCAMPAAKGLFRKAIMQSGPCLRISDKQRGTAIAKQLLDDLGLSSLDCGQLQRMDVRRLEAAAQVAELKVVPRVLGFGPIGFIPLVDGIVLPHHPFDTKAPSESSHVSFMVGSTKDEAVAFTGPLPNFNSLTETDLINLVRPMAGARAEQAVDLYKQIHPADSASYLLADIITDFWMRQAANRVAELKVKQQSAPVYVYVLEWQINPALRCPHAADVPLVFNQIASSPAIAAAANSQTVSDQMSSAWIAFARTGNPNTHGAAHWPAYSLQSRSNWVFDVHSRAVNDYGKQAREFWTYS